MRLFILLFLVFIVNIALAQIDETDVNSDIENRIESIAEQSEAELDYTQLTESLLYFSKNNINLNNTTFEELSELGLLSDIQIKNLLEHIKKNGNLISLHELQSVRGFDLKTIFDIQPYVKIVGDDERKSWNFNDVIKNSKSQWFTRYSTVLQQQQGYAPISDSALQANPTSRYVGSPYKLYTKYKFSYYNLLSVGITAEKDYGEEFFKGSQKNGFDFYSAHFFIKNLGPLDILALGDYSLQFGQGLTMWSGMAFGKSSGAVGIKKSGKGITPFSSVDENKFMRGAAGKISVKDFNIYAFASYKNIDANNSYDSLNGENALISNLTESGLHNTVSTVGNKDALDEFIGGTRVEYNNYKLKLGLTGVYTAFGKEIPISEKLYQKFNFTGKENINAGLDYSILFRNSNLFGEFAISKSGGYAALSGLMISPDRFITISLLHRYFTRNYHAFYSSAFQESSSTSNEHGFYIGSELKFSRKWTFSAYADLFTFPWLKYRVDAPSKGVEMLAQLNYVPSKHTLLQFKFRQENKQINSNNGYFNVLQNTLKRSWRFNASYPISASITLKSRADFITFNDGDEPMRTGFLIYQDISYKKMNSPFTLSARYALFDTDSYDERIYAYENDVLYASSIPAYYYKGSRVYLLVRWNAMRNLSFWARIAHTHYTDRESIGNGLTKIEGNNKTELKLQMRLTF